MASSSSSATPTSRITGFLSNPHPIRANREVIRARSGDSEEERPSAHPISPQTADASVELVEIDRSESLRTTAIVVVMLLFALGSIALVVLGRIIGRSVVAPLRSLGRTLRRFGDGVLRSRSEIAPDEVGTLARSFNVMADSVSARVRRLTAIAEAD